MYSRAITPLLAGLILLITNSCSSLTSADYEPIIVTGSVVESNNDYPLEDAIVRIISPMEETTTTNENGEFSFEINVDSTITLNIEVRKEGYASQVSEQLAVPERDIPWPKIKLQSTEGDDPDDPQPSTTSGPASTVELVNTSAGDITVHGSGGVENADFIFVIKDSQGRPVTSENAAEISFSLGANPGGGASISPESATTDESGRAHANLKSGTVSGVVQVIAEINVDGTTVRAKPVSITINAGLPDQDHFAIVSEERNIPGYNNFGETTNIIAFVGDKYGNIVSPGTSVYFTANGGYIEASAKTDASGRATVVLTATNPRPPNGFATVTAQTADENDIQIETDLLVLFSGDPEIEINPSVFDIANLSSQTFNYFVTDENGNPLVGGTNITVTAETADDDISVIGDVDITLGDHLYNGTGTTDFNFNVADTSEAVLARDVFITITAEGPNGKASRTITGTKQKIAP